MAEVAGYSDGLLAYTQPAVVIDEAQTREGAPASSEMVWFQADLRRTTKRSGES